MCGRTGRQLRAEGRQGAQQGVRARDPRSRHAEGREGPGGPRLGPFRARRPGPSAGRPRDPRHLGVRLAQPAGARGNRQHPGQQRARRPTPPERSARPLPRVRQLQGRRLQRARIWARSRSATSTPSSAGRRRPSSTRRSSGTSRAAAGSTSRVDIDAGEQELPGLRLVEDGRSDAISWMAGAASASTRTSAEGILTTTPSSATTTRTSSSAPTCSAEQLLLHGAHLVHPEAGNGVTTCTAPSAPAFSGRRAARSRPPTTTSSSPRSPRTPRTARPAVTSWRPTLRASRPRDQIMAWHLGGSASVADARPGRQHRRDRFLIPGQRAPARDHERARLLRRAADSGGRPLRPRRRAARRSGPSTRSTGLAAARSCAGTSCCPATLSVRQQGTIQDPSHFAFNGAISPATAGNSAVIFYNLGSGRCAQRSVRSRARAR